MTENYPPLSDRLLSIGIDTLFLAFAIFLFNQLLNLLGNTADVPISRIGGALRAILRGLWLHLGTVCKKYPRAELC